MANDRAQDSWFESLVTPAGFKTGHHRVESEFCCRLQESPNRASVNDSRLASSLVLLLIFPELI
jgi:hypothetical protein